MKIEKGSALSLRVMTYNIHKGVQFYSRRFVLHEVREAIREVGADIVFLQEVVGLSPRRSKEAENGVEGHLEYLADSVWTHFAYGKNAIYSSGHHGNAILCKYPILSWDNLDISTNRFEKRGILHAVVDVPKSPRPVHLICLHLDLLERGRGLQVKWLVDRIRAHVPEDAYLFVGGDFNDWRKKATETLTESLQLDEVGLVSQGEHMKTFPSWLPLLPLDRIYFRGPTMTEARVVGGERWTKLSDHQPLAADFILV